MPLPSSPPARPSSSSSTPPMPERSPLEPLSSYHSRLRKWRKDNAKWEGQRQAVRTLDAKKISVPPAVNPKAFP